jgi:hypothetical protein
MKKTDPQFSCITFGKLSPFPIPQIKNIKHVGFLYKHCSLLEVISSGREPEPRWSIWGEERLLVVA